VAVPGGGSIVVSVDSVVDGVHVDLALCSAADVGWKAVMGALSDLAAMGARPLAALVALCAPESESGDGALALGVMAGVAEAATAAGCPVVGGDVSSSGRLVVTVTVIGTTDGETPVARSGAVAGDVILVSGPCGRSAGGLRQLRAGTAPGTGGLGAAYRRPVARLAEGVLIRQSGAHAMIDVSDGLALDLHRLADASRVGFEFGSVPVAPGATLDEALGGGEDYELLVAVDHGRIEALSSAFAAGGLRPPLPLGVLTADPGVRRLGGEPVERAGWQHRLG
jgi:thiamine-monophosphate kinase